MTKSEQINELASALSKAQAELLGAKKTSQNPFFHSSYADLSAVWEACRVPLAKNGLAVIQTTEPAGSGAVLITTLAHSSGQWIEGRYPISPMKPDPQSLGSAVTYGRRYSLMAIVGIAAEDDDGNSASQPIVVPPLSLRNDVSFRAVAEQYLTSPGSKAPLPPMDMSPDSVTLNQDVPMCKLCKGTMLLSKAGTGYYCPMFKDTTKGEHSRFPVKKLEEYLLEQKLQPTLTDLDVPF